MSTQYNQNPKLPTVMATSYNVSGQLIPGNLSIIERNAFIRGLQVPPMQAAVFAMQDRASSAINVLAQLIENSGNEELIAHAGREITKWNTECDAFLRVR